MHIIKQHVVNGMLLLKLVLGYSIETILCLREKLITIFDVVLKVQLVIFWSFYYSDYRFCQCSCHYKSFDWAKLFSNYKYCYFARVSKRGFKARYALGISRYGHIKMIRRRGKNNIDVLYLPIYLFYCCFGRYKISRWYTKPYYEYSTQSILK